MARRTSRTTDRSGEARGGRDELILPIVAEEAVIGKRAREREAVRIGKVVRSEERTLEIPVESEEVRVERIPVGREVDGPLPPRREGGALIVPVMEQVPVVRMQWVVREEIRISKVSSRSVRTREVRLAHEEVVVRRNGQEVLPGRQQRGMQHGKDSDRIVRPGRRGAQDGAGPGARRVRPK